MNYDSHEAVRGPLRSRHVRRGGRQNRHPRLGGAVTEMLESQERRNIETALCLLLATPQKFATPGL